MQTSGHDSWNAARSYDHYMGRWSRLIAKEFLSWLKAPDDADWADIGCGTGALAQTIVEHAKPKSVVGLDPSADFIASARETVADPRATFKVADAETLTLADASVDVAASALALNFVPDMQKALREMQRVVRPGGTITFYVWDYPGGGMGFIDEFWKAAATFDPAARKLDEAQRFPFCTPDGLRAICSAADIRDVALQAIDVETAFPDFDAFWHPFTLGAGPAPGYCMSLPEPRREELKSHLRARLERHGEIRLPARAWAVATQNGQA
ncbi:MAG: class I SAM-dependent methyltransferase [Rhodospirillaceae bacterium]|nr:class I SAM-dependent methyltransferase [Rhodospirillaceae bacterium]